MSLLFGSSRAVFRTRKKPTVVRLITLFRVYTVNCKSMFPSIFNAPFKKNLKIISPFFTNSYTFSSIGRIGASIGIRTSLFDLIPGTPQGMFTQSMSSSSQTSAAFRFPNSQIISIYAAKFSTFTSTQKHRLRVFITSITMKYSQFTKFLSLHRNCISSHLTSFNMYPGVHNGI